MSSCSDYARAFGIKPSEVHEHQGQQLAELLRLAGCRIVHQGNATLALLPNAKRPLTLRTALRHAKRAGLIAGRLAGAELPAIEVQTTVRGETRRELRVWCVSCQRWHFHGVGRGEVPAFGPRVAHCRDKGHGAFAGGGYVLVDASSLRVAASRKRYSNTNTVRGIIGGAGVVDVQPLDARSMRVLARAQAAIAAVAP